ncbi:flagellar biosynthesis anti-sigma factor FlgM [Azohydromonas lata]|uniref:Negative regulator of flagellin synthesis n=1 Tax=Azohydromonas lata TaxID=45677 RepID=A0ABU5IDQ8_9BURK|nr:flagellar biosynthesis anti-sigma factor FlgM [Azohydromonas lata]MDZ5457258.1 flagellar biosynthesis anti-sigma factor FlgM [Azohydromonas lata]
MKIGPFNLSSARTTANGETAAAARPSTSGTASTSSSVAAGEASSTQVALSPAATTLIAGGDASFDTAKVQRIAQAIRDGSFRINAGAIADKLLDNAQELLARSPH